MIKVLEILSTIVPYIAGVLFSALLLVVLYVLFIIVPLKMIASAECLDKGYEGAKVTIFADAYCVNPTDTFTKVEKL